VAIGVTNTYEPFECIAVDTIGPLPPDEDGYCYIIVLVDSFTRCVELVPAKDCTAASAAKAILTILKYGMPKVIQSDNGPQYTADIVESMMKYFDIQHRYTLPHRPQANGIVERPIQEVMRHLKAIVLDKRVRNTWSVYLPFVQRIMLYSFHKSIGTYPARLLYGDRISPFRGLITKWTSNDNLSNLTYSDYVKQLDEQLKHIVQASQNYQLQVNEAKLAKSPESPTKYDIGDYVLVSYPGRTPDKFMSTWRGPLIIMDVENQTYHCRDLITNKVIPYFIDRLKPYRGSNDIDPKSLSMADKEEFYVDSIVDHTGDPKQKKSLKFRVRWLGYSPDEDTWEPYKTVRECEALDRYVSEHPELQSLK
jgi:hypothetical protein